MKKALFFLCAFCATLAMAQTQQYPPFGGQPPQRESAEVRATRKTQMLRDTLHLNSDQFNRVYKVYYNEYSAMEQSMSDMGGGMPPQGMGGGGMPPQGMGGGGMPPQGMGGGGMPPMGMGGGMPPQGMDGNMPAPPSMPKELSAEQLQKQQAKRQKKMKKILTEQQYELWFLMDTQPPHMPSRPQGY